MVDQPRSLSFRRLIDIRHMKTGNPRIRLHLILVPLLMFILPALVAAEPSGSRGLRPIAITDETGGTVSFGAHHALVIGNGAYTNGWDPLKGVAEDVAAVRTALERHGFDVQVAQDVTKSQIEEILDTFIEEKCSREDARIVVYYAGHGHTEGKIGYLVGVDAPKPTERGFLRKAYEIQSIKIKAQQIKSRHVLFLFDSCFSGSVFTPMRGARSYVLSAAREPVRMFLTSGSAEEQVPDQSFFRSEFIRGIDGAADLNHDGYVTGSELATYLKQAIGDRAGAAGMKLTPQAGVSEQEGLNRGDFVFVVPGAPAAAPVAVPSAATAGAEPATQRRVAIYAAADASDQAAPEVRVAAWRAVQEVLPAQDDRLARDDQMAARATAVLRELAGVTAIGDRARLLATARQASADPQATRRAKREAWKLVVEAWYRPNVSLNDAERAQLGAIGNQAAAEGSVLPADWAGPTGSPAAIAAPLPAGVAIAAKPAWASAGGTVEGRSWADLSVDSESMRFWLVPAEGSVRALWVAENECTQGFYKAVTGSNPSAYKGPSMLSGFLGRRAPAEARKCPVEKLGYRDVDAFRQALQILNPQARVRLPTPDEWLRFAGDDIRAKHWNDADAANLDQYPRETGKGTSNAFGLRDVIGNVWEMLDVPGSSKRIAGYAITSNRANCDAAHVFMDWPAEKPDRDLGFRCVIDAAAGP